MFIATSNTMSSQPIKHYMEIIKMSGYTIEEKVEIARQHLLQRQLKEHGLTSKDLTFGKSNWKKLWKDIP
jgi:ATP-dependent Lon protease